MGERRSRMLRRVARTQNMNIKDLKRRYKRLNLPTRLRFIAVDGQYITLTNEYLDQLKLGAFPSYSSQPTPQGDK